MIQTGENVALVTQTLIANADAAIADPRSLNLPQFLDLCALCEAAVLLDRMESIGAAQRPDTTALGDWLTRQGLYRTFTPELSRTDLTRIQSRMPEELAKRTSLAEGSDQHDVDESGAVVGLDYDSGLDNLMTQVEDLRRYTSTPDSPVRDRMHRANGYLLAAAAHGLDYFPDFDRVPFVAGTLHKTYRSLPVKLYDKLAESLDEPLSGGELVSELAVLSTIPIPPISALVLDRSASLRDLPEQLLRVRDEFARYRRYFADYKAALQAADTVRERRKLLRRYHGLLAEASGPRQEIVSTNQMLNLTESVVKAAADPALPTSYGALLLTQPVDWLRRWWQRRPLTILFRLDSKLPRLSEYQCLVDKLWDDNAGSHILDQMAEHGMQLRTAMADAEPA